MIDRRQGCLAAFGWQRTRPNLIKTAAVKKIALGATILWLSSAFAVQADDNLLAHRLFSQGDYADAAEIFTNPAWKGLALYRSGQWWRAAEAFIRANDAASTFNLGNCYVKLGYYALALDAYQQALVMDPLLAAADVNADIMRQLLALQDEDKQRNGRQLADQEIDRIETEREAQDPISGHSDEQQEEIRQSDTPPDNGDENHKQADSNAQTSDAGDASDQQGQRIKDPDHQADNAGNTVRGNQSQDHDNSQLSGSSESGLLSDDDRSAGLRTALQSEQATLQWLNSIRHDPQRYLSRRIDLETRRRQASGQAAPAGGSAW